MSRVREAMVAEPRTIDASASAAEAGQLLARPEVHAVFVSDGYGRLVGVLTRKTLVREVVAPGASLDLPWDGQVFVYEKTRGANRQRCECYRTEEVPPETYTVKVCGLRLTKSAAKSTKLQCAETTMTVPADEPQVITVEFPAP